ncbi:MAG: hypothetical protein IPG07_01470 [Crocinitomicaceae bacterium]|jgi:hypothetical protein|nr:hypothetical protein [Crocinitomicaceae bacterium]
MRHLISILLIGFSLTATTQTLDTNTVRIVKPAKQLAQPIQKVEKLEYRADLKLEIFGEYVVDSFAVLSRKTPSIEELNALLGTTLKVLSSSITGTNIDPMTFSIYSVERLERDDFIYRVFGREIKAPEPNLPQAFNVHKTDNENCYGIAEIDTRHIAIPYKGVLLFLTKK